MKDNITLCLNIFMPTYVFIFPLVPVRNFSTRAGCYNAFLHQYIAAHVLRHFCIHDEGLLLNYYTSCTIFKSVCLKKRFPNTAILLRGAYFYKKNKSWKMSKL
jgi:hypothetical protein